MKVSLLHFVPFYTVPAGIRIAQSSPFNLATLGSVGLLPLVAAVGPKAVSECCPENFKVGERKD